MPRTTYKVQRTDKERQEGDNCWQKESSWKVGFAFCLLGSKQTLLNKTRARTLKFWGYHVGSFIG
jgi:hypothetical protein